MRRRRRGTSSRATPATPLRRRRRPCTSVVHSRYVQLGLQPMPANGRRAASQADPAVQASVSFGVDLHAAALVGTRFRVRRTVDARASVSGGATAGSIQLYRESSLFARRPHVGVLVLDAMHAPAGTQRTLYLSYMCTCACTQYYVVQYCTLNSRSVRFPHVRPYRDATVKPGSPLKRRDGAN